MRTSHTRGDSPPRGMETVGLDIGETNKRNLAQRRIKKGECPTCGLRTYKIGMFGKKQPLTVEGKCISGRCLRCKPVEGYQTRPPMGQEAFAPSSQTSLPSAVGRDIVVRDDDDDNMSGITMDPALRETLSSRWRHPTFDVVDEEEEEEDFIERKPPRRPEPSVCPSEDNFQPQRPRPYPSDSIGNDSHEQPPGRKAGRDYLPSDGPPFHAIREPDIVAPSSHLKTSSVPSRHLSPIRDNKIPLRLPSEIEEETSDQKMSSVSSGQKDSSSSQPYPPVTETTEDEQHLYPSNFHSSVEGDEEKKEIQPPVDSFDDDGWQNTDPNLHLPAHPRQNGSAVPSSPGGECTSHERQLTPLFVFHPLTHPEQGLPSFFNEPPPFDSTGSGITYIPGIIRQLISRDSDVRIRGEAFRSLADLIWKNGDEAKLMVQNNHGIESVVECMWEDLGNPTVQMAAVDLIFALSACSGDDMGRDVFMGGSARNAVDALLIAMQTHISVESLQRSGCGALGCLASASKENKHVDDGTLSGAVSCVASAMDAHRKSVEVQKWGLWALYCQCLLSHNAENSQMNLAKGATEAGGMHVIPRAISLNESDMMALQWGCKLYWSLSFSDEICGMMTETNEFILSIMKVLRVYRGNQEAETVDDVAFGALANLARVQKTHTWLRESGIIARVFESMDAFPRSESVNREACALLANLVESRPLKEAVLTYGIEKIVRAMDTFPDSVELHQEALRALLCLSVDSEEAKSKLASNSNLNFILDAVARHQQSPPLLETGFSLIASLCVGKSLVSLDLSDVVDLLLDAMQKFPSERKLQEAVCLLLRNLSCRDEELVIESSDFFSTLLHVMKSQINSELVQMNLCCVITNLLAGEPGITCSRVDDGMNQIAATIQSHMESATVLEMACASVWQLISSSEMCLASFVGTGGVEYVKNVLLMHPDSPNILEKACGVLACLSGSPSHAQLVVENQGISYVVESMRAHSTSLALLENASVILRNTVLHSVENATEASGGILTIIAALKDNLGATAFEIEACNALWVMAALSEDCRQKILALDGLAVLMELMDNDSAVRDVREAAHGAFNQLAAPLAT